MFGRNRENYPSLPNQQLLINAYKKHTLINTHEYYLTWQSYG